MGPYDPCVIPLDRAAEVPEALVGGKAAKLARAARAGFSVPPGFCVTSSAYLHFIRTTGVADFVAMELGRKSLDDMRWEEIWDTALRIRSMFLRTSIPEELARHLEEVAEGISTGTPLAVRSSAPEEDAVNRSFAGLHESVIGVEGPRALLDAVRLVWASLWSDAALLYRRELALDPRSSRMAVLVQTVTSADRSGVAFGRDPRDPQADRALIEAVPGLCGQLVDGALEPDRWTLERASGRVLHWQPGHRDEPPTAEPLLDASDLSGIWGALGRLESLFGWPPDMEWTGRAEGFTLLQARPITTAQPEDDDKRPWYLSLRPGAGRLEKLAHQVAEERIPALEGQGERFAAEMVDSYDDARLAASMNERQEALAHWTTIYWDEFIPFAHGVRQLAQYYNDALRPDDPYEFVQLLQTEPRLASRRNRALAELGKQLHDHRALRQQAQAALALPRLDSEAGWRRAAESLESVEGGAALVESVERIAREFMDVTFGNQRLVGRLDWILREVLAWAEAASDLSAWKTPDKDVTDAERRFFEAVGPARREEAAEVLRIGRLSWRLRDDDNLLLSRIQSQLLRAAHLAAERLRAAGRLKGTGPVTEQTVPLLIAALRDPSAPEVELTEEPRSAPTPKRCQEKPRQLVGQPASPGLATGRVRPIRRADDLPQFRAGEVLVCDAIQPMMTHLVPLAAAIVERRGGMLIHGAIIARELGIPCVNGIVDAVDLLAEGEPVTVDGHLGLVTVGEPEFDLEWN